MYYCGYKFHAFCGLSGVIHSFDLTKASVHDIHYLKDVKVDYSNPVFAKARKRIEILFSQLCDRFMIIRNYAKDTDGLFTRIVGKISALTILQYINCKNGSPIGRVKYVLI